MKFEHVVCPLCGCLCDDLELIVERNEVISTKNACALSRSMFLNLNADLAKPLIEGKETGIEACVDKAIGIISKADYPLVYGLASTESNAQRKAVELAELLGGAIDSTSSICHGPTVLGVQMMGEVTCTLGTIMNQADLVVFWGSNPVDAHPRHLTRYSLTPRGLFTPRGRKGRRMIVVDVRETKSSKLADRFIQLKPGTDFEALSSLRALIKGEKIDIDPELKELAEEMKSCEFGALLFGQGLTMSNGKNMNVNAALALVRDLNQHTKFAILPMRGHYNVTGADMVFTWQTGYPFAIDFSLGYPRYGPGEFSVVDLLSRKEVDVALIIASDPVSSLPAQASSYLSEIDTIVIDPNRSMTSEIARVVIPTARAGISAEGTAYRMDGVPIRLKKVLKSPYPSDYEVLCKIVNGVIDGRSKDS